jgi:hypothetical protein
MKTKEVTVEVTQEIIDRGIWNDCRDYPVAMAINKELDLGIKAWVGPAVVMFHMPNGFLGKYHSLPKQVTDWMAEFDVVKRSRACQPFSFTLTVPVQLGYY